MFWKNRHLIHPNFAKNQCTPDTINHPHRKLLIDIIKKYCPAHDILEIGCGAGSNIINIRHNLDIEFVFGMDINKTVVSEFYNNNHNLRKTYLCTGDFMHLTHRFDIVLTDAVLIYQKLKNIDKIINKLHDISKFAIILCEWHDKGNSFSYNGHWVHDYSKFLPNAVFHKITELDWPDSKEWQKYGNIMEVDLARR